MPKKKVTEENNTDCRTDSETAETFLDWAVALLESIESDPSKKDWCRQYSVYSSDALHHPLSMEIDLLLQKSFQSGILISNYRDAADLCGLDDRQLEYPTAGDMSYLAVLACITWHFRRDHFDEGALIRESIADGVLLRLFRHLKLLCKTPYPATTLATLLHSKCEMIPDKPGIYQVIAPKELMISFSDKTTNSAAPIYPAEKLSEKYARCIDKSIVYIGKANGRNGLRQRIRQYMNYGCNIASNHKGGRAIWQIENYPLLLLAYEPCEDCEQQEHQLLADYKQQNGTYPLANWRG